MGKNLHTWPLGVVPATNLCHDPVLWVFPFSLVKEGVVWPQHPKSGFLDCSCRYISPMASPIPGPHSDSLSNFHGGSWDCTHWEKFCGHWEGTVCSASLGGSLPTLRAGGNLLDCLTGPSLTRKNGFCTKNRPLITKRLLHFHISSLKRFVSLPWEIWKAHTEGLPGQFLNVACNRGLCSWWTLWNPEHLQFCSVRFLLSCNL